MKFLLYAQVDKETIHTRLGAADYSYFFLLRAFAGVLKDLGEVTVLDHLDQAESIYQRYKRAGIPCLLLSFAPPHKTPLHLNCPIVPVFAWEYPDIPENIEEKCWQDDPRHDWRLVLGVTGRAICLSTHTADAVRRSMGLTYPIAAIPSPVAPPSTPLRSHSVSLAPEGATWRLNAAVSDSYHMGLNVDAMLHPETLDETPFDTLDLTDLPEIGQPSTENVPDHAQRHPAIAESSFESDPYLPPQTCGWDVPPSLPVRLHLHGVVYTSVLTPSSGRKNWEDLVTAFCWAFRDTEDATLVLKLTGHDLPHNHRHLLMMLTKHAPFKCRVIAIYGYVSDHDYATLIGTSTFYVNASLCEGQCLPLVEFLNEGVPAIAPNNTAMADYINDEIAFVVKTYPGLPTMWPHGDHEVNRTSYCQLDWGSLVDAYRRSYAVAHQNQDLYRQMAQCARQTIQNYCGHDIVTTSLHRFLCPELPLSAQTTPGTAASGSSQAIAVP
jgi:hypothetical protein